MAKGSHTWTEILNQPRSWRATLEALAAQRPALERFLGRVEFDQILVVGCGSTHYLAQSAAATLTHCTGVPARAFPSSELWLFPDVVRAERSLLLAISRSGTTTETLRAVERFRQVSNGPVMVITCHGQSPLAQQADLALVAAEAQEQSVAQTRSFTSMLLLSEALAAILAGDPAMLERLQRLPAALDGLVSRMGDLPRRLGVEQEITNIFYLGGGPLYGLANEAMLKTKEMSLSHTEAYHALEFRHGPMSMVNPQTLVVGLLSDRCLAEEVRVLEDVKRLGARTLALVEDEARLAGWTADHVVELCSGLGEWERGPLYLPPVQHLAYHRAMAKGLDPDRPINLRAVVEL